MQNRLTIKDIARLSGVGKSTVSRVLNNESGVSQRTRERVEAVMNQHGFSPSRSARAMRGQSDKVVAIIVTRLDSLSENLAVQTMLPAFYEQGYDPIMMESQFSPQLVAEHLGVLKNVAKVITPETTALLCATDTLALGASKYLQEQRIDTLQLASVGNTPLMKFLHPEIVTVDPGYAEAGRQAACQLIAQVTGRSEPQQIIIPATLS